MSELEETAAVLAMIAILGLNIVVFYYILKRSRFCLLKNPRIPVVISLTIGDFILASFSLTDYSHTLFEHSNNMTHCGGHSTFLAESYWFYVLPCVYSAGIIVTALELVVRKKMVDKLDTCSMTILLGLSPWLLGCTVSVPLSLAGVQWNQTLCQADYSQGRKYTLYIVDMIVPACLALLLTICVPSCLRYSPTKKRDMNEDFMGTTRSDLYLIEPVNPGMQFAITAKTVKWDYKILLIVSLIHSACTVLHAGNLLWKDKPLEDVTLWLMTYRCILTAICWLVWIINSKDPEM